MDILARPTGVSLDELQINVVAQEQGDWVPIPDFPPLEIKTRSNQTHAFQDVRAEALRNAARGFRNGEAVPSAIGAAINRELILKHCTLDWRGLTDRNKKPIPYDPDLLRQPKNRRLLEYAIYAASVVGTREQAQLDTDAKNSDAPSGGPAVTAETDPAAHTTG